MFSDLIELLIEVWLAKFTKLFLSSGQTAVKHSTVVVFLLNFTHFFQRIFTFEHGESDLPALTVLP